MLITKETDYALRILRALADGNQLSTQEICKQEFLPQQFVYKISKKLERAGLLDITRGINGGCRLTADLHDISLLDLIQIMDVDKKVSSCMHPDYHCLWRQMHHTCQVHAHLGQIQARIDEQLKAYNLYQILFETI